MTDVSDLNAYGEYCKRKLAHYNKWLLDPKRAAGTIYPGYDEEFAPRRQTIDEDVPAPQVKAKSPAKTSKKPATKAKAKPAAKPAVKAKKKAKRMPGEGPTKQETANKIFTELAGDKAKVIARIQEVCNMTFLGAQTYYYNARREAA